MVQVRIQGRSERYTVHKAQICAASRTFRQYFNSSSWQQPTPTNVTLCGVTIDVVQAFLAWLYEQRLVRPLNEPSPSSKELLNLYIFATEKSINGLRNDVLITFQDLIRDGRMQWGLFQTQQILINTTSSALRGSRIRRFMAMCLLWAFTYAKFSKADVMAIFGRFPDVLDEYLDLQNLYQQYGYKGVIPSPWLRIGDRDNKMYCLLHTHDQGEGCVRRA